MIDEAHCISDRGHDFRPDYRRLVRVLELLPADVPVRCTTATANHRVVEDIQPQLGAELVMQRGPCLLQPRSGCSFHVIIARSSRR